MSTALTIEQEIQQDNELAASDGHRLTDTGNSYRLILRSEGELKYVGMWGKWLVYRGGRWNIDHKNAHVTEIAKGVPRAMMLNLENVDDIIQVAGTFTQRDLERRWAKQSESRYAISSMIELARARVMVEHEELDADPEVLNVDNCTVNLRTGEWRPHDADDLMTMQSLAKFDPRATAPLWEKCLERWQPDPEIRRYLQVRAGACATGKQTQTIDIDHGTGANGKSVFHSVLQHILGPYAVVPHKSLLVAEKHEQHATVIADLFRKRYAVASETKARCTLNEDQVKNLTGGDRLSARRMREDPWEFDPSHTLILFSNYQPIIKGTDNGIWRRVRLVPWAVTIPETEQDPDLAEKLAAESSGILNWLVDGARIFLAEGLKVPESIKAATAAYRTDQDVIGKFFADCLEFDSGWKTTAATIHELADVWMHEQGYQWSLNPKELAAAMEQQGAVNLGQTKVGGVRGSWWQGVRVNPPEGTTP